MHRLAHHSRNDAYVDAVPDGIASADMCRDLVCKAENAGNDGPDSISTRL